MDDSLFSDLLDMHDEHVPERTEIQRAPFSVMGSKYQSIQYLMKYLPYRHTWVDHFGGSGVVTLNRQESRLEVFNDRYSGIVAFYRCLQSKDKLPRLLERVELTMHSREEFYHNKVTWVDEVDDVERASKWYYMLRGSMLGKGKSFGRQTSSRFINPVVTGLELFTPVHNRIRNVILENLDFETCLHDYDGSDVVHYLDPPYLGTDAGIYEHKWNMEDLERLLRCISRCAGFVALSHYQNEFIDRQPFWTARYEWQVNVRGEPQAYTSENNKAQFKDIKNVEQVTEVLYIKE